MLGIKHCTSSYFLVLSSFNIFSNTDLKTVSKILNNMAERKPEMTNPETKFPANNIITALITNKNKPSEIIVAGNVNKISKGLTNIFKRAITNATQIAVE